MSDKIEEIRERFTNGAPWTRATLQHDIATLLAEDKRLREALRWYADQRNHFPVEHRRPGDPDPVVIFVEEPPIMIDGGKRARKALEGRP